MKKEVSELKKLIRDELLRLKKSKQYQYYNAHGYKTYDVAKSRVI